jgi:lipopolysaccharide/colanic/teichoic acid biosynthesis glycosyltransferase
MVGFRIRPKSEIEVKSPQIEKKRPGRVSHPAGPIFFLQSESRLRSRIWDLQAEAYCLSANAPLAILALRGGCMRILSLAFALICLMLVAVPMLVIAVAIWIFDGRPIFFRQTRIGRDMKPFRIYKFRVMREQAPSAWAITIRDDPRITPVGLWLRRHHLDELPQLLNILRGEMSFVGPRPEIPEFVDTNDPIQQRVCQVRPGLFDSATLHWRDEAKMLDGMGDWQEYYRTVILPDKLQRSLQDIQVRSPVHNAQLLSKTILLVLSGK